MGRSYLGSQENISAGQIMLLCSYGEMFSRLPGKVSRGFSAKRESCVHMG